MESDGKWPLDARARDEGIALAAQILLYPPIDPETPTASRREFADGPFITSAAGQRFWEAYRGDAGTAASISPRSRKLSGVAPAFVLSMEIDPLRDEAEDYARALADAGVSTELHRAEGLFHGALTMTALIPRAAELHERVGRFLTHAFQRGRSELHAQLSAANIEALAN